MLSYKFVDPATVKTVDECVHILEQALKWMADAADQMYEDNVSNDELHRWAEIQLRWIQMYYERMERLTLNEEQ